MPPRDETADAQTKAPAVAPTTTNGSRPKPRRETQTRSVGLRAEGLRWCHGPELIPWSLARRGGRSTGRAAGPVGLADEPVPA
jgi:hypothetical protein